MKHIIFLIILFIQKSYSQINVPIIINEIGLSKNIHLDSLTQVKKQENKEKRKLDSISQRYIPKRFDDTTLISIILKDTFLQEKKLEKKVKKILDSICDCNFKLTKKFGRTCTDRKNKKGGDIQYWKSQNFYVVKYESGGYSYSAHLLIFKIENTQYTYILNLDCVYFKDWKEMLQVSIPILVL